MTRHRITSRRRTLAAAAATAFAMLTTVSACTSASSVPSHTAQDPARPATTPASSQPPPSSTRSSPVAVRRPRTVQAQAIAAYLGMWSDFVTAGHTSDWQSPLLSQHATAYALETLEKGLYTDHQNGVITKGAPALHPKVKSVSPAANPTVALVSDCGDSTHWLKYVINTGELAPGGPGGRQAITAEVRKQPGGAWKVDQFAVEDVGSC